MSGKERSPRHRPWSVYRANTFDLSAEMIGLALSGNPVTATMVTCILMTSLGRYTEVLLSSLFSLYHRKQPGPGRAGAGVQRR